MLETPAIVSTGPWFNRHRAMHPDLWECYAAGPESGPDPAKWRTELNRPLLTRP